MKKFNNVQFDFDLWAETAKNNPAEFEKMRLEAIEELISNTPAELQQRMRGLQWQIDQQRTLSKSPLGACIKISRMMWDSVKGPNGLLDKLKSLQTLTESPSVQPRKGHKKANIFDLNEHREQKLLQNCQ